MFYVVISISTDTLRFFLINQYKKPNLLIFSCVIDVRNDSTTNPPEWETSIAFLTQENQEIKGTLKLLFI